MQRFIGLWMPDTGQSILKRRHSMIQSTNHGEPGDHVAGTAYQGTHSFGFTADNQCQSAIQINICNILRIFASIQSDDPNVGLLQFGNSLSQIGGGYKQVFAGARGSMDNSRGYSGCTVRGDDHTVHTKGFGRTQQRPQVLRILEGYPGSEGRVFLHTVRRQPISLAGRHTDKGQLQGRFPAGCRPGNLISGGLPAPQEFYFLWRVIVFD